MSRSSPPAPGARVKIRDEEWLVTKVETLGAGGEQAGLGYVVHATGLSELVRDHESIYLSELDSIQLLEPEDTAIVPDPSPRHRRSRLYLEALLRRTPPTDSRIYLGHRGALDAMPYQLVPAIQALEALRPRILIADAVGLGKTLEAGILLSELIKRGRGRRILVVVVKSMLLQFQQELWSRFSIPLVRLDSVGIQRLRRKIPASKNPFAVFDRVIVSIDTLKNDGRYRTFLEACRWDAVVLDECHHVANTGSQRSKLAQLLAERCDALVLTSATPHNGRPASFANLMDMLDPTAIADPDDYQAEDIRGLFVRRFKKDVAADAGAHFAERRVAIARVEATPPEEAVLDALHDLRFHTLDRRGSGPSKDALFRTTLLKAFLSSPQACLETVENRLKRIEERLAGEGAAQSDLRDDAAKLRLIRAPLQAIGPAQVGKLQRLKAYLESLGWKPGSRGGPRVLVFSERRRTLALIQDFLREAFALAPEQAPVFHAGLPDTEQQGIVEDFGLEKSPIRVLIANDVASEGINLHYHCHHMVHFDVPWSLITLEQRNGRIDRYGQEKTPEIQYMALTTSAASPARADLRVLDVLIEKEKAAHQNLGDVAELLRLYDPQAEEAQITQALDQGGSDQVERLLDQHGADRADAAFDFLALCEAAGAAPESPTDATASAPGLFESELDFLRAAFDELDPEHHELHPDFHPERPSLRLPTPEGLRPRLELLPREALPRNTGRGAGGDEWYLTEDRDEVMQAIREARKAGEEGHAAWPAASLLWELHPVVQWLTDRVLCSFQRHEAPMLLAQGLAPGETVFLFQGQVSNKRGQPVLVDWFGIRSGAAAPPLPLEEVLDLAQLRQGPPNPGGDPARAQAAEKALPAAIEAAREHLRARRQARGDELRPRLQESFRRFHSWAQRARTRAQARTESAKLADGSLRRDVAQRLEQSLRSIDARLKTRQQWVTEVMTTEDRPYLRLAAVLVGGGASGPEATLRSFFATHAKLTNADYRSLFGVSAAEATRALKALVQAGVLVPRGIKRGSHYVLAGTEEP